MSVYPYLSLSVVDDIALVFVIIALAVNPGWFVSLKVVFVDLQPYIPCSSSPTIRDKILVIMGYADALKQPSIGAERKEEFNNFKYLFVVMV